MILVEYTRLFGAVDLLWNDMVSRTLHLDFMYNLWVRVGTDDMISVRVDDYSITVPIDKVESMLIPTLRLWHKEIHETQPNKEESMS